MIRNDWILVATQKERRQWSSPLRDRYTSLKIEERMQRVASSDQVFGACNLCGDLTINWYDGVHCSGKSICIECEETKGFCRVCRKISLTASSNQASPEFLAACGAEPCRQCGKYDSLRACSRCKNVKYCSVSCQKLDWKKGHKAECR